MGSYRMENDKLKVTIANHGAELISIFDKENEREVMWQADTAFWNRHAPVLFPNVGKHFGGHYLYDGVHYPAGQHGFARDMEFVQIASDENSVTYRLEANEETKIKYPFDFRLDITHQLEGNHLLVQWEVTNLGANTMYFTIGGHPAFNVPVLPDTRLGDYYLQFDETKEELTYLVLDMESGTAMAEDRHILPLTDHKYQIKENMFDKDALIFDDTQIEWAAIAMPDGTPYVALKCPGFPNFGIWSKPGAPYVCLEPWFGRCDNQGFDKDISEKPGIISLKSGEKTEKSYEIIVF